MSSTTAQGRKTASAASGFGRYVTRPIEVTAIRWLGKDNIEEVLAFLGRDVNDRHIYQSTIFDLGADRKQKARPGDWIIHDDGIYEVFTDTAFRAEFERAGDV